MDKKKILSVLFSGMLTFSVLTGNAHAADNSKSYMLYFSEVDTDRDGTFDCAECTGYDKNVSEIVIPDTIDGLPVSAIGENAFWKCPCLTSVTMPDSLVSIGKMAFQECGFESIAIPEGVTKLDTWAFCHCEDLVTVMLPKTLKSVGYGVFQDCVSLENIVLPESITEISANMFLNCEFLEKITVPEGVTSIGNGAFGGCYSLRSINIPENVTEIGTYAFNDCMRIKNITLPKSMKSIDEGAFKECITLKSITFENAECDIFDRADTISSGHDQKWDSYFSGVIYGHKNSTAQAYAKKYGCKFGDLDSGTEYDYKTVKGDANIDGAVNVRDTAFIAQMISLGKANDLPIVSDFNDDRKVDVRDAAAIAKYLASVKK